MDMNYILYGIFVLFLIISMWWDYRQHKQDKAVSIKSALWETAFRVAVATIFGSVVRLFRGSESTIQYFSGYLLEKSLSVDNLFVMIAIFSSFHIPEKYRHRVLYFGILGAIILRLIFISLGTALLSLGDWVLAVFGLIVLVTAIKMVIEERKKHISSHTRGRKHLEEKP
jgi:tellurite resistance protein TerC